MITVKATRQQATDSQPTHEDYVEKDENKRRFVPLAFLLFLTGCAAYLKSFLPVGLQTPAEANSDDQKPGRDDEEYPPSDDKIVAQDDDEMPTGSIGGQNARSSDNVVRTALPRDSAGLLTDSFPQVAVKGLTPSAEIRLNGGPVIDPVRIGLDNRVGGSETPGAGRGGGGGGGGGGADEAARRRGPSDEVSPRPGNTRPDGGVDSGSGTGGDPRNRPPRVNGPVYLPDVVGCNALLIPLLVLLAGASDADGDTLRVVGLSSSSGTVNLGEDGQWSFVREQGMLGDVTLKYAISDGSHIIQQTAHFRVIEAPPIIGTAADDNLLGTHCSDTIDGAAGDDNIDARDGNDVVHGGDGNDHIVAGAGNDIVYAGPGHDLVFAGLGNDVVFGGSGNDRLFGEEGDDTLLGEDGDDLLDGGAGADILLGQAGNDRLLGGDGNDNLDGGDGEDRLEGGAGDDRIAGSAGNDALLGDAGNDLLADGAGNDTVRGGEGDDHVLAAIDAAADDYDGGAGNDTLDYSAARASVAVDLRNGTATSTEIGSDTIADFEQVVSGEGDDHLIAGPTAATLKAGAGDDLVYGGEADDTLEGGAGDDVLADGAGSDIVHGGDGNDHVVAAADAAADRYHGGSGCDTLDYSVATLSVTVDLRNGTAEGAQIGRDLIENFEHVIGGSGNDHFVAGAGPIFLAGGGGNNTFEFRRGDHDHQPDMVRRITDFDVGDRIITATYEIYYRNENDAQGEVADLFDDLYLSGSEGRRPVRFRFEQEDDNEKRTVIEVHDRPDDQEFFSIQLSGHHDLQFTIAVS